jgi:hypothetical protein
MYIGKFFKVYDPTTTKIERTFRSRKEALVYADKIDPNCKKLWVRELK